jgi:methionine-rich copper-binding protein CopC
MKTLLLKLHKIILLLLIITPMLSNAQKEKAGVNKEFTFDETSKTESFTFAVNEGTKELKINFEGNISEGSLKVKITDPDGNKISGFSLKSSKSKNESYSSSSSSNSNSQSSSRSSSSSRASASSRSSASTSVTVDVNDADSVIITETDINSHIYTTQKTETNNSRARGVLNKTITNPTQGVWKFSIYPDDASGKLSAKITYK